VSARIATSVSFAFMTYTTPFLKTGRRKISAFVANRHSNFPSLAETLYSAPSFEPKYSTSSAAS
jgi:hypothetical protein